jgi:hypothetical protein
MDDGCQKHRCKLINVFHGTDMQLNTKKYPSSRNTLYNKHTHSHTRTQWQFTSYLARNRIHDKKSSHKNNSQIYSDGRD